MKTKKFRYVVFWTHWTMKRVQEFGEAAFAPWYVEKYSDKSIPAKTFQEAREWAKLIDLSREANVIGILDKVADNVSYYSVESKENWL